MTVPEPEESLQQQLQQPSPSPFHSVSASDLPHLRHAHQHNRHTTGIGNFESLSPQQFQYSENNPNNLSLISNIISTSWKPGGSSNSSFNHFTLPNSSTGYMLNDSGGGSPGSLGLVFPFNLSSTEMEEIQNISNTTFLLNSSDIAQNSSSNPSLPFLTTLYSIIVPVMIFFCVLTCLVNLVIVMSAKWCRKPMSPTLYFSISLALADAYAAFILGAGLVINSLLPKVFGIQWKYSNCVLLTMEVLRQGGILVSVCHLLALGINHWIGIVRPLHYAATMTRRTAWIVIVLSWICPILMLFIYYSSISEEGYLSSYCRVWTFLREGTYRGFFASCFFAPLLLMSLIYIHIFLIVRNHHSNRLRYQVKKKSCHQLQRNVKAVLTTILILGTYIIGWMPAIVYSIMVCDDCLFKLEEVPLEIRYAIGITVNTLIILKALLNPIIYAARMSDIQLSLKKMRYAFLHMFCKCCVHALPPADNERGFSKFNRSLYDTKSVRMSSFGSSSSSRRPTVGAAVATNLLNCSPGHQSNHAGGFNNSISYKNHNGNSTSNHHSNPKSKLLHNKSAFEMTEMH